MSLDACQLGKYFKRKLSIEIDDLEKNSKVFGRDLSLRRSSSIIQAEGEKRRRRVSNQDLLVLLNVFNLHLNQLFVF